MHKPPANRIKRFKSICNEGTPGPGTYMPPSDFGYLEMYKFSPRTSHGGRS